MQLIASIGFPVAAALMAATPRQPIPTTTAPVGIPRQDQTVFAQANSGDPTFQFMLGRRYCLGNGVPRNYAEAARWFQKAADQGHANAQCELGYFYRHGVGVTKDPIQAMRWYRPAAERGHGEALLDLGTMLFKGEGVPMDRVNGYAFCLVGYASQGREFSMGKLENEMTDQEVAQAKQAAILLLKRIHPLQDSLQKPDALAEPQRIREEKAEDDDPVSPLDRTTMIELGQIEFEEEDRKEDGLQRRITYLRTAADRGIPYAQMQLARAYEIGEGVPKDPRLAAQLYRRAAEQGNADAQYNLAIMYSEGDGVPKNEEEARKWFAAAAASVKPKPWPLEKRIAIGIEYRETRIEKRNDNAFVFFLVARKAGNPEAQACLIQLEETLSKNDLAACQWYADWIWRKFQME